MKKILMAIGVLYGGGAERVVSIWASELAKRGYNVSLLMYGRGDNEYPLDSNVQVYTVANTYQEYIKLGRLNRLHRMRKIIKEINPDIVISFLSQMQIWMMFSTFGRRLIRIETIRNNPWESYKTNKIGKFLWQSCFRRADKVIIQTQEQGAYFDERIKKKCVVIPNPISKQYIDNPKTEYSERITRIVAVGRITPQKNYPLMIRSFEKVCESNDEITLSIYGIGDADYTQKIQKMIDDRGLTSRVRLMGRTTNILSVLRSSDAFLMASDYEGMPNALVEAMTVGLVCVSTNCRTGPRDLIDNNKNGYLVTVGDERELATAIKKICRMPKEEGIKLGKAAREKVLALCCEENSIKRLIDLIED